MADHKLNYFPEQLGQNGEYIPIVANAIDITNTGNNQAGDNWHPLYLDQSGHFVSSNNMVTLKNKINDVINRVVVTESSGTLTITINTVNPIS